MIAFLSQPWPWYVAGPFIALTMFLLLYFGKNFGVSGNLRTICAAGGAGSHVDFFKFDWKKQIWNLMFALGTIGGGFVAYQFLTVDQTVAISQSTVEKLNEIGFANPGAEYLPPEIFSMDKLTSLPGLAILLLGGFLVGFGARYAGGCTSGHAISGMSDLQIPSLIAVIGFFIGGLTMTYFILPIIF